jgi:hypothetical protein
LGEFDKTVLFLWFEKEETSLYVYPFGKVIINGQELDTRDGFESGMSVH